mmetsp:Transcript_10102/g.61435  ORF Transcript_10102/g.61435 Transcript_10102/m.61435 type:complete len:212 (+) Transcript_10102:176-811(+)
MTWQTTRNARRRMRERKQRKTTGRWHGGASQDIPAVRQTTRRRMALDDAKDTATNVDPKAWQVRGEGTDSDGWDPIGTSSRRISDRSEVGSDGTGCPSLRLHRPPPKPKRPKRATAEAKPRKSPRKRKVRMINRTKSLKMKTRRKERTDNHRNRNRKTSRNRKASRNRSTSSFTASSKKRSTTSSRPRLQQSHVLLRMADRMPPSQTRWIS